MITIELLYGSGVLSKVSNGVMNENQSQTQSLSIFGKKPKNDNLNGYGKGPSGPQLKMKYFGPPCERCINFGHLHRASSHATRDCHTPEPCVLSEHYNNLMQMETIPIELDHKEGTFMNPIGINRLNNAEMIAIKDKDPIKQVPKVEADKSNNLNANLLHQRKNNALDEQGASLCKNKRGEHKWEHDCI